MILQLYSYKLFLIHAQIIYSQLDFEIQKLDSLSTLAAI